MYFCNMIFRHLLNMRSHPTWVRGLKLKTFTKLIKKHWSHPTWVRGLKLKRLVPSMFVSTSHPTWVRGLKLLRLVKRFTNVLSHPTWVRGLKPYHAYVIMLGLGRTLRGCVD